MSGHSQSISQAAIALQLERARSATDQFSDLSAAVAAGYRRIGMDFPSMGQHWVNPRLVIEGEFDVAKPAMLTYIVVNDRPVLTGVVYAIPLSPGDSPPNAFGATAVWHEHNGTIDEESLAPEHHTTATGMTGTRLAILHAWVRTPNPDGTFAAENWALPFIRLGLQVPKKFPLGAARALALASAGDRYFLELSAATDTAAVSAALADCAAKVKTIVPVARTSSGLLSDGELAELENFWNQVLSRVSAVAGVDPAKRMNGGVAFVK
ncbi:MAG: hypothetical protein ABR582_11215 [Gemmatimonadaceae bacterium]